MDPGAEGPGAVFYGSVCETSVWTTKSDQYVNDVPPLPPLSTPATEMRTCDRFAKVTVEKYLLGM